MRLFQKLFPPAIQPSPDEIQQRLMKVLDFKKDDLKENQYGRMSNNQHYWFIDDWLRRIMAYFGAAILLGVGIYYFERNPITGTIDTAWVFIMLVAVIGVAVSGLISLRDMLLDIVTRKIENVSGLGKLETYTHGHYRNYALHIDDVDFPLSKALYDALVDGQSYTVYYGAHSKTILAIEVD